MLAGPVTILDRHLWSVEELGQDVGELACVARLEEPARLALDDAFGNAVEPRGDNRDAACLDLEGGSRKRIPPRRRDHAAQAAGQDAGDVVAVAAEANPVVDAEPAVDRAPVAPG